MGNYTVYVHLFPNDMVYVGLTEQSVEQRWGLNGNGYKKQPVYKEIQYYGWNNIKHIIVKENLSETEAQELEDILMSEYSKDDMCYNVAKAGGLGGNPWVTFIYNETEYTAEELLQFSEVDGLTAHDLTTRINHHGWSIEKALSKPKTKRHFKYFYNDNFYTVNELLKLSPIKDLTIAHLLGRINHYGWDIERALTQPTNTKKQPFGVGKKIYEYNGQLYNSYELLQISNVEGLTSFDITNRINKHGWSVEKAITQPKKKMNIKLEYEGKLYSTKEIAEMSCDKDMTCHNVTDRLKLGWSVDKIVNTPLNKSYANQKPSQDEANLAS